AAHPRTPTGHRATWWRPPDLPAAGPRHVRRLRVQPQPAPPPGGRMTVSAAIRGVRCTADLFAVPPVPSGGQRVLGAPVVSKQGRTSLSAWDLHVVVPYYN